MNIDNLEKDSENILELAGKNGKFQKYFCVFFVALSFIIYFNITVIPIEKIRPDVRCILNPNNLSGNNFDIKDYKICDEESYCNPEIEKRIIVENSINNWTFYFKVNCENESIYDLIVSATFLGGFISFFIMSPWADKYGRKPVLGWEIYGLTIVLILSLIPINLNWILVLWFFYEFFKHVYVIGLIYAAETMSQEYFSIICSLSSICFPVTGLFVSLIFSIFKNWWIMQLIFTLICLFCVIIFKFLIIESPQFCIERKDLRGFITSVKQISFINNTEVLIQDELRLFEKKYLNEDFKMITKNSKTYLKKDLLLLPENENKIKITIFEYFNRNKIFRNEFLIVSLAFSVVQLVFYGLLLNIEKFDQDIFLITTILYASEIFGEMLSGFLAQKFGRIIVLKLFFYIAGFSFFLFQISLNIFILRILFCFIGNFAIASCFNVMVIYMAECFDINIRSSASTYCRIPSQFVVIFCPYFIGKLPFPFFFFSLFCFVTAYLIDDCHETLIKEEEIK